MAKSKSISDLVTDLQKENEKLQHLNKLFEKAVKNEFGHTVKELHTILYLYEIYSQRHAAEQEGSGDAPQIIGNVADDWDRDHMY